MPIQQFASSLSLIAPNILNSLFPSLTLIYFQSIQETEAQAKKTDQTRSPKSSENFKAYQLGSLIHNIEDFDLKYLQQNADFKFSRQDFTRLVGIEFTNPNQPINMFKNSILIDLALFQYLKILEKVLDICDFSTSPVITKQTLTFQDVNGLNLLNHVCRNRGVIGDRLAEKIIDIYVENLDQETLAKAVDNFIFTLPKTQFLKVAGKIGLDNLSQIFSKKLTGKEIKTEISKYHSPDLFVKRHGNGFEKRTLMNNIESRVEHLMQMIKLGYGVQISQEIKEKMEKQGFSTSDKPNVYITSGDTFTGKLPDKHTYQIIAQPSKSKMLTIFKNQTIYDDFLANHKNCKKVFSKLKTNSKPSKLISSKSTSSSTKTKDLSSNQDDLKETSILKEEKQSISTPESSTTIKVSFSMTKDSSNKKTEGKIKEL